MVSSLESALAPQAWPCHECDMLEQVKKQEVISEMGTIQAALRLLSLLPFLHDGHPLSANILIVRRNHCWMSSIKQSTDSFLSVKLSPAVSHFLIRSDCTKLFLELVRTKLKKMFCAIPNQNALRFIIQDNNEAY